MFILQIVIILFATKLAGHLAARLGQPSVLGKIIVGIILGPALLGWIHDTELLAVFSQIGVLLLMFLAGLETDLQEMNKNKKAAIYVALGGIILPIILGYAGAQYYGMSAGESIFIGLLLSATSVSISVQAMRELGWLNSKEGSTLLGAAVLDDIVVVILIAIAMSFFAGSDTNIGLLIGKKILFFAILIVLAKWFIPHFIRAFKKFRVTESILSAGLIICFGLSYFAEFLGIAGIIGAFFAGIAIAQTEFRKEIEHKVEPIAYGIFVPFFFVSIGLAVSFDGIGNQIGFIVVFSIIAVVSKFVGSGLGAKLAGFNTKSSMGVGAGMVSRGEVALILAAMGLEGGLLPANYYTSVIIVIIVTTIVTPPLLKAIFGKRIVIE
ncbi:MULTISPECIES: cation:proton antiporter [Solibacillus]|uniref:Cation:proton antiporter n=1 Tax=Solibacillus merdavium TaxID=2762218 RepID=A0ABR8XJW8_9BACL|nr:cation:proton antiporter [Solibacillus merdavium]MBD8032212.1 cation:proton antiporter [Solibacillus merdavium]